MPILQISRITQRKGLQEDLPQPLASAELGWAVDQRRLFIGNGTIAEGAPVVGNTEILTEFSDILSFATTYIYQGAAAGYQVQTGSTPGNPVTQSLQSRLDTVAVVTDFGAVGDGVTDCTDAINRALYQLYCREVNPQIRRGLYFPAGVYVVSDTIKIPPYAYLYGEGADSSIVYLRVDAHTSDVAWATGVLVESGGSYYRSQAYVPIGIDISNTVYWSLEDLPDYIARTADSLQQVGANIKTNNATAPVNIQIERMAFKTNQVIQGFLWEDVSNSRMSRVTVQGPLEIADLNTDTDDTRAIDWASTESLVCTNVVLDDCVFSGFTYGTQTAQETKGCVIANSKFDTLYQGAVLGDTVVTNGGSTGFRLVANSFDNIYNEGIEMLNVQRNVSAYNTFYDVGNHFNGVTLPFASIIVFADNNNISLGDTFERDVFQSQNYPCIDIRDTNSMSMSMNVHNIVFYQDDVSTVDLANALDLGTYQQTAGIQDILADDATANLVYIQGDAVSSVKMDYSIVRDDYRRRGSLVAVKGQADTGTGFSFVDDYVENGSTGITISAVSDGANIMVGYSSTSTGSPGTIKYTISSLG